ncbi:MAG: hydroxymethylbilane synthase [Vulcanimicrobiota bacterium]
MTVLKLGTRGSDLALTQSRWVAEQLENAKEGVKVELVVIKTRGDRDQNSALNKFAGKGIFTKEIEDALLAGQIDFAVHSLKDLPTTLPDGLALAPPPRREDPRDLLVSSVGLEELSPGAVVGTGSARRREQLRLLRPDLRFEEIRGNVATRVRKWREGLYDATVLACAGVERLGLAEAGLSPGESRPLELEQCLPAPGQGVLGLEIRQGDRTTLSVLSAIACPDAIVSSSAERAFLAELDGGCHIPAGAHAEVRDGSLKLHGFLALGEPLQTARTSLEGRPEEAAELGRQLARELKRMVQVAAR